MIARELIQFIISDSKLGYFKKKSNLLELALIAASIIFILSFPDYRVPAGFIILISSVEILMLLPVSTLSTYMYMLKTVSETFMKFFRIFLIIILAFTFTFYSFFRPLFRQENYFAEKEYDTEFSPFQKHVANYTGITYTATSEDCNSTEYKNFNKIVDSFLKTTLMLAGQNNLEPNMFQSFWEKLIFFIFLITALVLLNLINGLAISDIQAGLIFLINLKEIIYVLIQELKNNALYLNMKQRIRSAGETESFLSNLYWKARYAKKFSYN